MANRTKITSIGIISTLAGILWLLVNVMQIEVDLTFVGPGLLLFFGLALLLSYMFLDRDNLAHLIVGVFLTLVGIVVLLSVVAYQVLDIQGIWQYTIFTYPGALAIALWVAWHASGRKLRLLIPATMLTFITILIACFAIVTGLFGDFLGDENVNKLVAIFWPLMLILSGLLIISMPFVKDLISSRNKDAKVAVVEGEDKEDEGVKSDDDWQSADQIET